MKVLVTGGSGFLGQYVVKRLKAAGRYELCVPRRSECDLARQEQVELLLHRFRPEAVLHLATVSGGMAFYKDHPGEVFYQLLTMATNLLESSRLSGTRRVLVTGTSLIYPENAEPPYSESVIFAGPPHELEAPYGLASRSVLSLGQSYQRQYGIEFCYVILPSLYGPCDHFDDPSPHVIPALIKRVDEAKRSDRPRVVLWGTGAARREFLFVEDAARMLVEVLDRAVISEPLNLGSGVEVSIAELAQSIKAQVGFDGELEWDNSKPEGRLRRSLDSSRARAVFDFGRLVDFHDGLARTTDWYRSRRRRGAVVQSIARNPSGSCGPTSADGLIQARSTSRSDA